eukprot:scaffold9308_cov133-Skeletonema_dohrnii-CCMP3373.AAC.5
MVEWSTRFHFEGRVYNRNCRNWYDVFLSFALKPWRQEKRMREMREVEQNKFTLQVKSLELYPPGVRATSLYLIGALALVDSIIALVASMMRQSLHRLIITALHLINRTLLKRCEAEKTSGNTLLRIVFFSALSY